MKFKIKRWPWSRNQVIEIFVEGGVVYALRVLDGTLLWKKTLT